jgi:chromosomal replication initiation ATPase DnaA
MAMLRRKTGANVSTIGRIFGRDHTTVIHGIRASEQRASR